MKFICEQKQGGISVTWKNVDFNASVSAFPHRNMGEGLEDWLHLHFKCHCCYFQVEKTLVFIHFRIYLPKKQIICNTRHVLLPPTHMHTVLTLIHQTPCHWFFYWELPWGQWRLGKWDHMFQSCPWLGSYWHLLYPILKLLHHILCFKGISYFKVIDWDSDLWN